MADLIDAEDRPAADEKAAGNRLVKKALIDAVTLSAGQKKPVVKEVVDAVLAELSAALARGDTLVLPPLGRVSVARTKESKGGEVMVLKLRRQKEGAVPSAPESDAEE